MAKQKIILESNLKHYDDKIKEYVGNKAGRDEIIGENLLPYPYPYKDTTKTVNGITFTDNGDGSVTMNGTATADAIFLLSPISLKAGTYTLSVDDSGFNSNYCNFQMSNSEKNLWWGFKADNSSIGIRTYTLEEDLLFNYNRLLVKSGYTMNNVIWKPMVEVGSVAHPYQPYNLSRKGIVEQIVADNLFDTYTHFNRNNTGVTASVNASGNGLLNGTINSNTSTLTQGKYIDVSNLKVGESITASVKVVSGTYTPATSKYAPVYCDCIDSSNSNITDENIRFGTILFLSDSYGSITYTMTQERKDAGVHYIYPQIWSYAGDKYNNLELQIMIEKGTIAHPFQPYDLSRQGIVEQIVADNLINYPYIETTHTDNGIQWTDLGDGTIKANGTNSSTSTSIFYCRNREGTNDNEPLILPAGTYTLSGCPKGGSRQAYYMSVGLTKDGAYSALGADCGDGFTFTLTEEAQIQIVLMVMGNATVNNIVFKPMIEIGTVAHEYQPYNLSRHKLREDIDNIDIGVADVSVTQSLTSGTQVGTITVDGETTNLYAPTYNVVTTSANGLMSKEDKAKLDSMTTGGGTISIEDKVIDYKEANIFTFNNNPTSVEYEYCYLDSVEGKVYFDVTVTYASSIPGSAIEVTVNNSDLYILSATEVKYHSISWYFGNSSQGGFTATSPNIIKYGGGSGAASTLHRLKGYYSISDRSKIGEDYTGNDAVLKVQNRDLPVAGGQLLGVVKTTSSVTSNSGYEACPIIDGVPYYKGIMTKATSSAAGKAGLVPAPAAGAQAKFLRGDGTWQTPSTGTDTKNTAGSTNSSSKLFLIGATSQAANPQTYSHDTAYVGTDGCLYSNSKKVSVDGHTHSYAASSSAGGSATKSHIAITNVTEEEKTYVVPFITNTEKDSDSILRGNNGLKYLSIEGTTSDAGYGVLAVGNGTATSNAGNKYGIIRIYGTGTKYVQLKAGAPAGNRTVTFPNISGSAAVGSNVISFTKSKSITLDNTHNYILTAFYPKFRIVIFIPTTGSSFSSIIPLYRSSDGENLVMSMSGSTITIKNNTDSDTIYVSYLCF